MTSSPTTAPGRRERNKADKRARILQAARQGLARQGYAKMTTSWVAEQADVATGTVFQYARTKPELLMLVTADRWGTEFPEVLAAARDHADPLDAVLTLLTPLVTASRRDPDTTMAIARELLFGPPGEHHDAVLDLVGQLELAIADIIEPSSPRTGRAAARLITSGALVELNRARREGEQDTGTVLERVETLVRLTLAGAAHV